MRLLLAISFLAVGVVFTQCRKENPITDPSADLQFSTDTLVFDTVFTTVGSTTKRFKVYNRFKNPLIISSIELSGGSSSPFRINVDGVPGDSHENIEIPPEDSIFIFVEVTLAVNNSTNPMVIEDSIIFETNGNRQNVDLVVWGQDAYFHYNEVTAGVWPNDKPHVIYGFAACGFPGIDSMQTLTIQQGTQVHVHANSFLLCYKSTLDIQGVQGNEVVFQGDRLEQYYDSIPGQWEGIYYLQSENSTMDWTIVKNANTAIRCDTVNSASPALTINHSKIHDNAFAGVIGLGSHIVGGNNLIANNGQFAGYFGWGGTYQLTHCTFGGYWSFGNRQNPTLVINNYYEGAGGQNVVRDLLNCEFHNCIIHGNRTHEFAVDTVAGGVTDFYFNHCIYRSDETTVNNSDPHYNSMWAANPDLQHPLGMDYHLKSGSFAIDQGDPANSLVDDLDGNPRDASPDLGAFEF